MVDIDEFLSPERLLLELSRRQQSGSCFMTWRRSAATAKVDASTILTAIEQRERLGTTGIGEGIAIPHARVPGLAKLIGYFARLAAPIDYDALDDAPVDLVFLLLAPEAESTVQLKALARVARILRDPEVGARLRTERDGKAFGGCCRARPGPGGVSHARPARHAASPAPFTARRSPGAARAFCCWARRAAASPLCCSSFWPRRPSSSPTTWSAWNVAAAPWACGRGHSRLDRAARQRHLPHLHHRRGRR